MSEHQGFIPRFGLARRLGWLGGLLGLTYVLVCAAMFGLQRRLLFPSPAPKPFPESWRVETSAAGLPVAMFAGSPEVVYFHGQASSVARLGFVQKPLGAEGLGVLLAEYPGYAGAPGSPSEATVLEAARAAITLASSPPVCAGQSLGTGVAARMAAEGRCAKLVLLAPYTSITEMAGERYRWLPTGLLLLDRFDTASLAARISVPTLILHGTEDHDVPTRMGRALAERLPRARLLLREGRHHNDLWRDPIAVDIARFARE